MPPTRADETQELAKIRASLASVSDHITPLTATAHRVLRFVGDAEARGYWDDEAASVQALARQLRQHTQRILTAAEEIEQETWRL